MAKIKLEELPKPHYDPEVQVWVCPIKACDGKIVEVDKAIRYNHQANGTDDTLIMWATGDGDFHNERYECNKCGQQVVMPEEVSEDWV